MNGSSEYARRFGRNEAPVLEALRRLGGGTAREVRRAMTRPPDLDVVRVILEGLVGKQLVLEQPGPGEMLYRPARSASDTARAALLALLQRGFHGSVVELVRSLLDATGSGLSSSELGALADLVRRAGGA